ncbi:MAG: hypothetical protein IT438_02425 [Phycisphaerales bacterium]|nr:hypothetical protein [Phycisphaerales bacterium]
MHTSAPFAQLLVAAKAECLNRLLAIVRGSTNETQARLAATAILRYDPVLDEEAQAQPEEDIEEDAQEVDDQDGLDAEAADEADEHETAAPPIAAPACRPAIPLLTADELAELRRRLPQRSESQLRNPNLAGYWRDELTLSRTRESTSPTAASPPPSDRAA